MLEPGEFYRQSISLYNLRIAALKRKIFLVSMARLFLFALIIAAVYLLTLHTYQVNFILLALAIAGFLYLLRVSINLNAEKKLSEKLVFINNNELSLMRGEPNRFDNGSSLPAEAIYVPDLDILGENSLYHHLNRTVTPHGSQRLSQLLQHPFTTSANIKEYQAAVKQLSLQPGVRQLITARAMLREKNGDSIEEIRQWIDAEEKLSVHRLLKWISYILPVINISAFVYYLDTDKTLPLLAGIAVSWIIIGVYVKYINRQHAMIGKKQAILEQYAFILNEYHASEAGASARLQALHHIASAGRHEIRKLSRLTGFFDQRLNVVVNFLLNSFLLYDIHCTVALENWKKTNRHRFGQWIDAVGEIELLNSLATFSYNHPDYCYPEISDGSPCIKASDMAHPLIPAIESVSNDFSLEGNGKLMLITGSNMSGKSTFLRTAGINLLLAQCGAPVCAASFTCSPMLILSSIRINDSLQDHTSYFMAELTRLRQIITALEAGSSALVLIDEVLRGTNSNDKTHGSEALIKRLIRYKCISLFATHDLSLSELEYVYPDNIINYCFESTIENGELLFDYKLHRGVATNKNATFLMQKMGIISA